jgi:hypothetical protein
MRLLSALLVVTSIGIMSFGNSYAQTPNIIIYAQIVIQDANGNLVAYLESGRVTINDLDALNKLIDQNADIFQKSTLTINNQNYDLIKAKDVVIHSSATIVSENTISGSNGVNKVVLVSVTYDGYPVVKGDKVTTYWTILRPAS